jgi:hypothetical protein
MKFISCGHSWKVTSDTAVHETPGYTSPAARVQKRYSAADAPALPGRLLKMIGELREQIERYELFQNRLLSDTLKFQDEHQLIFNRR